MPRALRSVLPGLAYHITQRGVDRRETFSAEGDRTTYLRLLRQNLKDADVSLLAWCLMSNHVHLVAIAGREDSLAVLLRRVQGRYAQYYNVRTGRTGHLWQNRYFACALGWSHLRIALAYVERNPLRAGLIQRSEDYKWSSAGAHITGFDEHGLLDMQWWAREGPRRAGDWRDTLNADPMGRSEDLISCTYSGKPFGTGAFVQDMAIRFGRRWKQDRSRSAPAVVVSTTAGPSQVTDDGWLFPS
jgi:putative transposase